MERTKIRDLYINQDHLRDKKLTVAGWIKSIRDMKQFAFLTINDGSCFKDLQIVINHDALNNYEEATHAGNGAAIIAKGQFKQTPNAPQPFELQANKLYIEGTSAEDYPLQKKRTTPEFLRTIQHLRPRTNLFRAVFRIRSVAAFAIHEFFQNRGFLYVHTPIITASDCEGAGEMFNVTSSENENFFGTKASLTVSGQLNAENFAMAFGDVYTFGPTFRAENSNTPRHAAEFWMIEPEIAFADLSDDMDLAEDMLKSVISYVIEKCPDELNMLNRFVDKGLLSRLEDVAKANFERISYSKAIKILEKAEENGTKFEYPIKWGVDLQTEHERYLTEKHFKKPVFVYNYPAEIKAFYMRMNEDGKTVAATDCLVPKIGEIIGGSQREERLDVLKQRIEDLGMNPDQYKYYLDLRKYGSCKHAGFGLGFERLIMYLTGINNIRDVLPHPRTVGNAQF